MWLYSTNVCTCSSVSHNKHYAISFIWKESEMSRQINNVVGHTRWNWHQCCFCLVNKSLSTDYNTFSKTNKAGLQSERTPINNSNDIRRRVVFPLSPPQNKLKVNQREKSKRKKSSDLSPVVTLIDSRNWAGLLVPLTEWWTLISLPSVLATLSD